MAATTPTVHQDSDTNDTDKETGSIDEQGVATASVTYRVPTITDAATYGPATHALGMPEVGRTWVLLTGSLGYETTINYKGSLTDDDDEATGDTGDYSMDISFSEEEIEKHWNLEVIMEKYGGNYHEDDTVYFDPELSEGSGEGISGSSTKKNPMFKVKTYLALAGVFRHTYTSRRKPKHSYIGNIITNIPGGFDTPEDHDWLVMPPKMQRRGRELYQVTQEYLLSQKGGWPEHVYDTLGTTGANNEQDEDPFDLGDEPFEPAGGWENPPR